MTHFDEKSGIIPCTTPWGRWWQTMEEVYIEVDVPEGTTAKEISCCINPSKLKVDVKKMTVINGKFPATIQVDDSIWTLEDRKLLKICLIKMNKLAENCWNSLLVDQYKVDPFTFDKMEQKMTLQRFQEENPGFDFSGATVSGNYHGGGPQLPSS